MIRAIFFILLVFPMISWGQGLSDFEGRSHELEEYIGKGKWTVVMIWAHNCPLCNQEAQKYDMFNADHEDKDATVLGISIDGGINEHKAQAFIDRHELEFTNLIGTARDVAGLHISLTGQRLMGTPTFILFSPSGEISGMQVGPLEPEIVEAFMQENTVAAAAP